MTRRRVAAIVAALAAGCGDRSSPSEDATSWFVDVTAASGLTFRHDPGAGGEKQLPEIMGGGVALLDHDGDGDLDLFFAQGAPFRGCPTEDRDFRDRLFQNDGRGRFVDVTAASHCSDPAFTLSAAAADVDGDGDPDLLLCGLGGCTLLRNDGGVFSDVTSGSGLRGRGWCQCAAFADFDQDGDLDLYVGHYVVYDADHPLWCGDQKKGPEFRSYCHPDEFRAERDELYRNDGGGTFTDVSEASGVAAASGKCLGLLVVDDDNDGDCDLYVVNDSTPNFLWRNEGGLRFREVAMEAGCAVSARGLSQASMGVDAADVDDDGDFELFVTNLSLEPNALYRNDGNGFFSERGLESGLGEPSLVWVGFGCRFQDVDRDGLEDLFVVNGDVVDNIELTRPGMSFRQPSHLYVNQGGGRFTLAGPEAGPYLRERHVGRALATWDQDDDGDLDLVVVNHAEPAVLLENRAPKRGGWIGFKLRGAPHNGDAIGARVTISAGGRRQMREVRGTCSYGAWCDLRLLFGLGAAAAVDWAEIRWPRGSTLRVDRPAAGRYHEVREEGGEH